MKPLKLNSVFTLVLSIILISSVSYIPTPDIFSQGSLEEKPMETFTLATTYEPGVYPSGLTLFAGDLLNGTMGGIYNVTGNFTIVDGAYVDIVPGYKIVVFADNIIISGQLRGDGAGYAGGINVGEDGDCVPASGGGQHGGFPVGGGGGGAHGSYGSDGDDYNILFLGGRGGLEYGAAGFANVNPTVSDISLGAGGGVGGHSDSFEYFGTGGNGGGGVYLAANNTILIDGLITCNGENGGNSQMDPIALYGGGGGGGGAGGGILLSGDIVRISGTLSTLGGSGGLGDTFPIIAGRNGGKGSGGRIKIAYLTSLNTTSSLISGGNRWTFYKSPIDFVKPIIELTGVANNSIHRSGAPIVLNISDSRDIQLVQYNWDNKVNFSIPLNDSSYILETTLPSPDGEHILEVFAQDVPGNWNYKTFTYFSDDIGPVIILNSPNNNTVFHSGSVIDFTVFDVLGLDKVMYNWDGGTNESLSEPYEILVPDDDGEHILSLYASDMADNWVYAMYTYVTDDTSPLINSPDDIVYNVGTTDQNITWTLTDLYPHNYIVTGDNLHIESGDWASDVGIIIDVADLSVGSHIYTIIAFDEAGNMITDSVVVTVLEETTGPPIQEQIMIFGLTSSGWIAAAVLILILRRKGG